MPGYATLWIKVRALPVKQVVEKRAKELTYAPVETLFDKLAQLEVESLDDTLALVMAEAVVKKSLTV